MSSTQMNDVFVVRIRLDYLMHSIVFIPWAFLYLKTFNNVTIGDFFVMSVTGVFMATFTEGIQYFLTYRSFNINDLMANWLGVGLGVGIVYVIKRWSERATGRGSDWGRESVCIKK